MFQTRFHNHADNCEVTALANRCPIRDGDIVYAARGLYRLIYNDPGDFNDNCNDSVGVGPCDTCGWLGRYAGHANSNGKRTIENITNVQQGYKLFPNPNNGSFILAQKEADEDLVSIQVLDAVGREVYKQRTMIKERQLQLHIGDKPTGMYILQVTDSQGRVFKFKFTVSN